MKRNGGQIYCHMIARSVRGVEAISIIMLGIASTLWVSQ